MGKVTRAVFDASTATVFADNTNEDISEGDFRTKFDDVSASAAFLEDVNTFSKQQRWKKGADVASATVLPLIEDGNYFDVTGTVTVTSFADLGGAGTVIILQFDAACILTHHATNLILPTGGNITTAAGDHAIFVNYASGDYRCVNYQRKDGTALVGGDVTKVGTPVNNQVGVWTSDGNLEGDSKLTFDGTTLGVTGGATFSGILTLGSTLSNGTYTYTLPSATGTLALTSDVTTAVANLVDTAPSTLDTLNELAAALGDDPNFATTVTNSIATKLPLAGGTLTGTLNGTSATFGAANTETNGNLNLNGGIGDSSTYDVIQTLSRTSSTGNVLAAQIALTAPSTYQQNLVFRIKTTASAGHSASYFKDALTISPSGNAIFTGALSGTSLTFSSTITALNALFLNSGNSLAVTTTANTTTFMSVGINSGANKSIFGYDVTDGGFVGTTTNNDFTIRSNNVNRVTIAASTGAATFSGNVGIGATPSAWSDFKVLEFANGVYLGTYTGGGQTMYLGANNYFNGTDYIYKVSAYATRYQQASGVHAWYTSTISGTEGNVASFNQSMALTAAGRLLINTPTESTYQLDVNGTGRFSSTLRVTNSGTNTLIWAQGGADGSGQGKGNIRSSDQSGANYWDFGRDNLTTGDFIITEYGGSPILRLISSTGAATFSSSVQAVGGATIGSLSSGSNAILDFATNASGSPRSIIYRAATAFIDITNTAGTAVFQLSNGGAATFSESVTSAANFISNSTTNTPSTGTSGANNATYNYLGYSGYWGIRTTATGNNFALDTYNGGTPKNVLTITQAGAATFSGAVNLTSLFPVFTIQGTVSSPHIGSTWSVSANQDGAGRTIIGTAGQARAMYFENNGDIVIPNNSLSGTSATFSGAVSKGSGSFRIEHPLPSLSETHQLVHSFVESPQADLIYRGKLTLVNGKAQANIDEVSTMTEGTFEVLCREVQCFTTNESGWDLIKGKVIGNIIYIESQNETSADEISWMVIGERKDKHMMETEWTDENGKVIVEPLKPIEPEPVEEVEPTPSDDDLE
jgi:hypothetical protein